MQDERICTTTTCARPEGWLSSNGDNDVQVIRRVVVGVDGSELSRFAFAVAIMIADAAKAEMLAMHVLEGLNGAGSPLAWDSPAVELQADLIGIPSRDGENGSAGGFAAARQMIEECAEFCRRKGIAFSSSLLLGPLLDRFLELEASDLLVVGKGRFGQVGLGSSARRLLQAAPCPVLIASGPLMPLCRVICAYDGSDASERAFAIGKALSTQSTWPLTVIAVADRLTLSESLQAAQDRAPHSQVIAVGPEGRDEASQIQAAAALTSRGVIIVPARAQSWLNELFHKSLAGELLTRLEAPIVFVH